MPWNTPTAMSLRRELVLLASQPEANVAELARRYAVSRKTAYKWIARYRDGGVDALADRPRSPQRSPNRTPPETEHAVLRVREAHPRWGGRKIRTVLLREQPASPSPATITAILRRHGRLSAEPVPRRPMTRFEAEAPNDLWQMDHKGDFLLGDETRCFPLTVLDDHSRFSLCIDGQLTQQRGPVQDRLTALFERYGLPRRLLCDNGRPWGSGWRRVDTDGRSWPHYTGLAAWAIRVALGLQRGQAARRTRARRPGQPVPRERPGFPQPASGRGIRRGRRSPLCRHRGAYQLPRAPLPSRQGLRREQGGPRSR